MNYRCCIALVSLTLAGKILSCHAFGSPTSIANQVPASSKKVEYKSIKEAQERAEKIARDIHPGNNNHAMNALFVNIPERPEPLSCTIASGKIPEDLPPGCFMRTGPNGGTKDMGFLDGDGMVHCITIPPKEKEGGSERKRETGRSVGVTYSSTYVETQGRQMEKRVNGANMNMAKGDDGNDIKSSPYLTYSGTLGAAPQGLPMLGALIRNGLTFQTLDVQKDTCNTALAYSGNRVLALMEQSPPTEIQINRDGSMETIKSMARLDGGVPNAPISGGCLGAHGRTDPVSGERIHVSYTSILPPFVRVDFFDSDWKLTKTLGVDLPAPVMVHDCALTQNYVVVMDFPLTIRPRRFLTNSFPVEYEPENGARIGLVPRSATSTGVDETLWFDVESGVVLHAANAFETDDGKVILHGLKSIPQGEKSYILDYTPSFLYEWVLDPSSGKVVSERCLNPSICVEFPVCEEELVGKKSPYIYCLASTSIGGPMYQFKTPQAGVLLDTVVKFAVVDNNGEEAGDIVDRYDLPHGWHCVSEPTIVPKTSGAGHYILLAVTYVPPISDGENVDHVEVATNGLSMKSQCHILDGDSISKGPVTIIDLPCKTHMNYGLHSLYLPWEKMA